MRYTGSWQITFVSEPTLKTEYVFLCEHASNKLPSYYRDLLPAVGPLENTHLAYDLGAHKLATFLAKQLKGHAFGGEVSRLLVDLNRSTESPELFSRHSRKLPVENQQELLDRYYLPYRQRVRDFIQAQLRLKRRLVILAVHSFTPTFKGRERKTEIGLLFRHDRPNEVQMANHFKVHLEQSLPGWLIHKNLPYRGFTDAHLNSLVDQWASSAIYPLFLEVRQDLLQDASAYRKISRALIHALSAF